MILFRNPGQMMFIPTIGVMWETLENVDTHARVTSYVFVASWLSYGINIRLFDITHHEDSG